MAKPRDKHFFPAKLNIWRKKKKRHFFFYIFWIFDNVWNFFEFLWVLMTFIWFFFYYYFFRFLKIVIYLFIFFLRFLAFLDLVWTWCIFFIIIIFKVTRLLLKFTEVSTKHQKWPKKSTNSRKSPFFAQRAKKEWRKKSLLKFGTIRIYSFYQKNRKTLTRVIF